MVQHHTVTAVGSVFEAIALLFFDISKSGFVALCIKFLSSPRQKAATGTIVRSVTMAITLISVTCAFT